MPEIDVEVTESLVRGLLADLPPELTWLQDEPLAPVAQGWDNAVWRVGDPRAEDGYAVRIPIRRVAAPLVECATRWVAELSSPLRDAGVAVPVPLFFGSPSSALPWAWFLVEWVPGRLLAEVPVAERGPAGMALARALPALHRPAPPNAPVSPSRGVSLAERQRFTDRHLPAVRSYLGATTVDRLLAVIDEGVAAPWPGEPLWCHGDLHAANLTMAADGSLGILDFDDLTSGDPAVDLRVLWLALDGPQRDAAMQVLAASGAYDDGIWARARGWAASSFVIAVAADPPSREPFAAQIDHALEQLL